MKKIMDIIKSNYVYISFTIFFILLNICILLTYADNEIRIVLNLNIIFTALLTLVFAFVYNKWNIENIKIEKLFLITAIPIGILYLFAFPYGTIMDEQNHFLRIYEITDGHFVSELNEKGQGGNFMTSDFIKLPQTVTNHETQLQVLKVRDTKTDKIFYEFSNTALYSFICYIPPIIGVGIGKIFNIPFLFQVMLGRLTNFIVFLVIMYFSIKKLPYKKMVAYIIATLPITFQEAISLAPDALTISMSFAIISFTLHMIYTKKEQMSKWHIALMCLIAIVISMCKIVYLPFCLMLLLIPKERFGSLKKKNIIIISLAVFVVAINLGWTLFVSRYLDSHVNGSSSSEQVAYLISKPYKVIPLIINTFNVWGSSITNTLFGSLLGYYTVQVFLPYIYSLMIIFIACVFTENQNAVKISHRLLYGFIVFSTLFLMGMSLYIQWTPYQKKWIDGIQGRYLIPLLLLISLISTNKKVDIKGNLLNKYVLLYITIINLSAISGVILHFV